MMMSDLMFYIRQDPNSSFGPEIGFPDAVFMILFSTLKKTAPNSATK